MARPYEGRVTARDMPAAASTIDLHLVELDFALVDDGPMTEVDINAWRDKLAELEDKLSRYPHVIERLAPPATERELADGPARSYSLPEWVKELYRWHNGADHSVASLFGRPFLSLKRANDHYAEFLAIGAECGWFRPFFFPIAGVDSDFLLVTLDSKAGPAEPSVMSWCLEDVPGISYRTPCDWVDSLLWKLDYIDEDSFADDGSFLYFDHQRWPARWPPTSHTLPKPQYVGTSCRAWAPAWLERAGIDQYLISDSELPPPQDRQLPRREHSQHKLPLPHPGPWNFQFDDMGQQPVHTPTGFFGITTMRKPEPPWAVGGRFLLPEGVVSEKVRYAGNDLNGVVWLEPDTLEDELPVIAKVRFPMPDA